MVGRDCVGGACIGNGALPGTFAQITAVRPGKMYALRGDPKSLVAKEANQP
jgi:hypothetical protein